MNNSQPEKVENNVVVTMNYTVKVDGDTVDTSQDHEPIEFIQGQGHVIQGLESNLYGLQAGERKEFVVPPDEGYGELDPDALAEIPLSEFPTHIPLEPGVELLLKDEEGDEMQAYIVEVGEENVMLNFNHPLAGKDMHFSVEVVSLRWATAEELDHGHVHTHGHSH
jgi:FKBP-type peptidyl-prolyl cis-trans isomerase SlyD